MPVLTKLFDDFADAFGRDSMEKAQKEALARGEFHAREGRLSIGQPLPAPEHAQTAEEWLRQSKLIEIDPMINGKLRRSGESVLECMERLRRKGIRD